MTVDEQQLVERVRSGESEAFQELVERYKQRIYYLAYDLMGTHQDAEDASQEVFVKAYLSIGKFRGDSKLSSWLHRITVNACHDMRRKKRPLQIVPLQQEIQEDHVMEMEDPKAGPQEKLEQQYLQGDIEKALDKLTPRERTVFVMRHYHDLMLKDIADNLKISEGTVKSLLFRALRRLRKVLHPYERFYLQGEQNG